VDWYDDPDSRVDVWQTARDDLRGIRRLQRSLREGRVPVEAIRATMGRTTPSAGVGAQTVRFGLVGVGTTILHLGLFAGLASTLVGLGAQTANLLALFVATLVNTEANRRWTFGVLTAVGRWRSQLQGLGVNALTWAMTAGALAGLLAVWPGVPTAMETLVVGVATVVATVVKFVAMRSWMFAAPRARVPDLAEVVWSTSD
ncbi:MAG: GtrA family protein, partial [Nocardioides sp.]